MRMISFLILVFALPGEWASAQNLGPLYRSTQRMGMGGAFVGLSEGHESLYYNPAGLGLLERPEVHYLTLDAEISSQSISTVTDNIDSISDGGVDADLINTFLGKDMYARGQMSSTVTVPYFGLGLIFDYQFALRIENKALPQMDVGIQDTRGVQMGFAVPIMGGGRMAHRKPRLMFGVAGKALYRRGGITRKTTTEVANILKGESMTPGEIAGNFSLGVGLDMGLIYSAPINKSTVFRMGASFTDIGDTTFMNATSDPQEGNFTLGMGLKYTSGFLDYSIIYDYSNILQGVDLRQKNHLGFELGFPIVTLYAGVNQTYFTYGLGADVWILKLSAVSYAEEVGSLINLNPSRRYLLRLDFSFSL